MTASAFRNTRTLARQIQATPTDADRTCTGELLAQEVAFRE